MYISLKQASYGAGYDNVNILISVPQDDFVKLKKEELVDKIVVNLRDFLMNNNGKPAKRYQ